MFKQTLFLILSFSITLNFVHSRFYLEDYKYVCADELEQGGVCKLTSTDPTSKETTLYVKKCGKGKACEEADDENFGGCYKVKSGDELRDEDEKCKVNEECLSQNCVSGKCKYIADGAECDDDYECKPSSHCSGGKCKAYSKAGEKCDDNEREPCINGYVCGTSGTEKESKCIAKYSIGDGTVVSDPQLCKSGFSDEDDDDKCTSLTPTSKDCNASGKCSYKTASNNSVELEGDDDGDYEENYCQVKSDGKTKACREINGELWNKYVEAYGKRLNKIKDDKNYNRHSSKWTKHLGDRDVSDAFVEWKYSVFLSDASDCVKDFVKQKEASSNFLVFNLMVIISFALILI